LDDALDAAALAAFLDDTLCASTLAAFLNGAWTTPLTQPPSPSSSTIG
jgi:hypothetical protein